MDIAQNQNDSTRKCPFCGEEVKAVAQKCKHCGELFNNSNNYKVKKILSLINPIKQWIINTYFIEIMLITIAVSSGFMSLYVAGYSESAFHDILSALETLIFVVCIGFLGLSLKNKN